MASTSRDFGPMTARTDQAEVTSVRNDGYSVDDEEFMDGMAAVAVPICDDRGRLLTTLSIHAPVQRHDVTGLLRHLSALQAAASQLERIVLA